MLLVVPSSHLGTAATNPYDYHDCTWTAWQYAHDYLGITLPSWGYADDWCDGAERDGYPTGSVPAVNAIMVWRGHVGFITQVSADGQSVYIIEGGWDDGDNWRHEGWYAANGPCSSGKAFVGYIYLADVPADTAPVSSSELDQAEGSDVEREAELADLRQEKAALVAQIDAAESELADLTDQLDQANQESGDRLRTIYMFGSDSYMSILFSAKDFSDFIERAEQVSKIIASDRNTINTMEKLAEERSAKKAELEQALAALNEIHI